MGAPLPDAARADVVSAASLLFVLRERRRALRQLLGLVQEDGVLLVIETTPAMRPGAAWRWLRAQGYSRGAWMLLLWAWARNGRAVQPEELRVEGWQLERAPLLGGLVAAWTLRRGVGGAS